MATSQSGCASRAPQTTALYARAQAAPELAAAPAPTIVRAPEPIVPLSQIKPMPGRSRGAPASASRAAKPSPQEVIAEANHKASQAPASSDTFNAIVQYSYEPGTLYQVFAAPMRITDIALEPGEKILGQPASGDVVRWLLALGKSMDHGVEQWHIYLKPTRPDLETNLAINTDRRSYLLELHSYAETYMAQLVWHYPEDELARLQAQASELATQQKVAAPVVGIDALNFNYTIQVIKGSPAWTPLQAFDDGRRTFLRFPEAMLVREAPALFVLRDKDTQLVNYRVKGDTYVIDRLIDSAELRVGQQDQEIVRIVRGSVESRSVTRPIHARFGQ
ncbi:MAG TPA: P-type conjugative transfer protein TrbG [Polyangiaceae bacterium]|jgi:type IV secretion system protein VirB9|nr:P-type conjugative transfer protein TrbG [Polyangiaceae bacterium]